jgi:hypothetical protein
MKGLTYTRLAERYKVELCTGWCGESGHNYGWWGGKRVHFRERGVTRSGLRRFLMLVHDARHWPGRPNILPRPIETAQWIHSRNVWAYQTAFRDLGIRLPRTLSAVDRARVRHLTFGQGGAPVVQNLRRWAQEE